MNIEYLKMATLAAVEQIMKETDENESEFQLALLALIYGREKHAHVTICIKENGSEVTFFPTDPENDGLAKSTSPAYAGFRYALVRQVVEAAMGGFFSLDRDCLETLDGLCKAATEAAEVLEAPRMCNTETDAIDIFIKTIIASEVKEARDNDNGNEENDGEDIELPDEFTDFIRGLLK